MKIEKNEIVKNFVAELMIQNPRIKVIQVYNALKDNEAFWKTSKRPYSKKDVEKLMDLIREEWAEESFEQRQQARKRQLREIQLIKTTLFQQGDFKTLERYLRLEKDLLGTDHAEEREDRRLALTSAEYIRALEEARKYEEQLVSGVDENKYLEIVLEDE